LRSSSVDVGLFFGVVDAELFSGAGGTILAVRTSPIFCILGSFVKTRTPVTNLPLFPAVLAWTEIVSVSPGLIGP
jgi:hypothetical protein